MRPSAARGVQASACSFTRWRDDRWGDVIDALLSHDGPSRLVLTSRLAVPVGQSEFARSLGAQRQAKLAGRLLTLPVHALSLDETALLARQLPGLRARCWKATARPTGFSASRTGNWSAACCGWCRVIRS